VNSPSPRKRSPLLIAAFLVVVFLYWAGLYLYVPTLPLYVKGKTEDLALVGTVLSMYGLWQLISRLPLGIVVDWVGRRKPFIISWLVILAAGDLILGTAPNITTAGAGRALVGVAAGCWVPLVVMFSGLFDDHEVVRATGIISMVGSFARIIATSANGWLNGLGGYPLAFYMAAAAALLGALIMAFLPDAPRPGKRPDTASLWTLIRRPDVLRPSLLQALAHNADFAATFTFIPILARLKGASDVSVSLLLSLNLAMSFLGNFVSAAWAEKIGRRNTASLAFVLLAAGTGGAALAPSLPYVFAFGMLIGFGLGLGYPLLMGLSIAKVDAAQRTTAMGLHQSIYSLGMFAGPWLGGILASRLGIPAMFAIISSMTLVLGLAGSAGMEGRKVSGKWVVGSG
jgi:predicted MFS family arabinose efflux permease